MPRRSAIVFKAGEDERNAGQDPYAEKLETLGIDCQIIPVLCFEYINLSELKERMRQPDAYSGIIFSSPRVVEAAKKCLNDVSSWKDHFAFAVGEKTAEDIKSLGLKPSGGDTGIGAALAEHILKHRIEKPLLLPCGNLSTNTIFDALNKGGVEVDRLVVYKTIPNPRLDERIKLALEKSPSPLEFLLYFSPSGVKATMPIFEQLGFDVTSLKLGAIGPTTKSALADYGGASFVAEKPTPEHFTKALERWLERE